MGQAIKQIDHPNGKWRVTFFRHADGSFGFEEWTFHPGERVWIPWSGAVSGVAPRIDTLEHAIREAKGRIAWLAAAQEENPSLTGRRNFQLSWKTLPGLRGLSCSEFHAVETDAPDHERGVAFACAGDADRDVLVRHLEESFARQRFSNAASAFEAVKACALEWTRKGL
jgi:hypothetical protein